MTDRVVAMTGFAFIGLGIVSFLCFFNPYESLTIVLGIPTMTALIGLVFYEGMSRFEEVVYEVEPRHDEV